MRLNEAKIESSEMNSFVNNYRTIKPYDDARQDYIVLSLLHETAHVFRKNIDPDGRNFYFATNDNDLKDAAQEIQNIFANATTNKEVGVKNLTVYEETYADALAGILAKRINKSHDLAPAVASCKEMRFDHKAETAHNTGDAISRGFEATPPLWIKNNDDFMVWANAKAKVIAQQNTLAHVSEETKKMDASKKNEIMSKSIDLLVSITTCADRLKDKHSLDNQCKITTDHHNTLR